MEKYKTSQIAAILQQPSPAEDIPVTGFSIDSRTIKPGDCFFAIKGENFHGEDYLQHAFNAGAACAVVSKQCGYKSNRLIKTDDAVIAMGILANHYRQKCGFKVIAVTGSAGKTTTRNMIYHVLSGKFKIHRPEKNFNNHIGLPITLLNARSDTQICVVELGANAPGEISYLSKIAQPDITLITNTYPAHLEGFGSLDNIIREKASIADGLRPGGKLIVNERMKALKNFLISQNQTFTTFKTNDIDILSNLPGRANTENIAAAWHAVKDFQITTEYFKKTMQTFKPVEMRMQIFESDGITVINDCYNANPASMAVAVELLEDISQKNCARAVFVCGDMFELGSQSDRLHTELGLRIAEAGINLLLAVGTDVKKTIEAAAEKGVQCFNFENASQLAENIFKHLRPADVVLIKGSRGVKLEKVADKLHQV